MTLAREDLVKALKAPMDYYGLKKWDIYEASELNYSVRISAILSRRGDDLVKGIEGLLDDFRESEFVKQVIEEKDHERLELEKKLKDQINELKKDVAMLERYKQYYDLALNMQHGSK